MAARLDVPRFEHPFGSIAEAVARLETCRERRHEAQVLIEMRCEHRATAVCMADKQGSTHHDEIRVDLEAVASNRKRGDSDRVCRLMDEVSSGTSHKSGDQGVAIREM